MLKQEDKAAIRGLYMVPPHVLACASAIRYDLMHGPSWSRIPGGDILQFTVDCFASYPSDLEDDIQGGDSLGETYTGVVASTLRDYIDSLPSKAWYDSGCGFVTETEPDSGYEEINEESGEMEWVEYCMDDWYSLDSSDIVGILLGETIAREFS